MATLNSLPSVKILFYRILEHRRNCKGWKQNKPCFDCHFGTLTPIERELENVYIE
jgi:hypothetical protein